MKPNALVYKKNIMVAHQHYHRVAWSMKFNIANEKQHMFIFFLKTAFTYAGVYDQVLGYNLKQNILLCKRTRTRKVVQLPNTRT